MTHRQRRKKRNRRNSWKGRRERAVKALESSHALLCYLKSPGIYGILDKEGGFIRVRKPRGPVLVAMLGDTIFRCYDKHANDYIYLREGTDEELFNIAIKNAPPDRDSYTMSRWLSSPSGGGKSVVFKNWTGAYCPVFKHQALGRISRAAGRLDFLPPIAAADINGIDESIAQAVANPGDRLKAYQAAKSQYPVYAISWIPAVPLVHTEKP